MNDIPYNHFLRTKTFAHRGIQNIKKGIVENTLESCLLAMKYGYGIEIDVRITKYNTVILLHDYNIKRLTGINKKYYNITEKDINNIKYKNSKCKIAKLKDVLDEVKGKVPILIELKTDFDRIRTSKLIKEVNKLLKNYNGDYAIQSVFPSVCRMYKEANKNVLFGLVSPIFFKKYKFVSTAILFIILKIYNYNFISYNINMLPNIYIKRMNMVKLFWNIDSKRKMNIAIKNNGNLIWSAYDGNYFRPPVSIDNVKVNK